MAQWERIRLPMQETQAIWVGKIPWRRECQPTPVFLPGESHGQKSLAGYSPRGCKELDTTERLRLHTGFLLCRCTTASPTDGHLDHFQVGLLQIQLPQTLVYGFHLSTSFCFSGINTQRCKDSTIVECFVFKLPNCVSE